MIVSAAVAGAALYGGAALSDPREPSGDDRLIAVPAAPSVLAMGNPIVVAHRDSFAVSQGDS